MIRLRQALPGEPTLVELGVSYLDEISPCLGREVKMPLISTMKNYISSLIPYEQAQRIFLSIIGRCEPIDRLREVKSVGLQPLSITDSIEAEDSPGDSRKKTRPWTTAEDNRLLAGILRYGTDNWTSISLFIGNGRTRAQACQRWTRGLNPRISKDVWSYDEDLKLFSLVDTYGDRSWTKIASMMGNRSDVQCRYHYKNMAHDFPSLVKISRANSLGNRVNSSGPPSVPLTPPPADAELNFAKPPISPHSLRMRARNVTSAPLMPPIPHSPEYSPIVTPEEEQIQANSQFQRVHQFRPRSSSSVAQLDSFLQKFS